MGSPTKVVVLAGGFGGARMAHGFALLGDAVELTVVVNTGDDLELHGLAISPDLDTVMYTLSGLANAETGWGVRDETWSASEMLERYGQPTWFKLGDRDLATHIARTAALRDGERLTQVTADLASRLGITATLLPMTDDRVRTKIRTESGWIDFQDYFVRRAHTDGVLEVAFEGAAEARPSAEVLEALGSAALVVIAPSNPFVSVAPILALSGTVEAIKRGAARVVAVSPIVGGAALRGPAAHMLSTLEDLPKSSVGIARHYAAGYPGLVETLVIDEADAALAPEIERSGIRPLVTNTLIAAADLRRRLADELLSLG
ncbi:MAG: 2-phospho-L-lactate transferase [Chloroflexota bacterium]